MTENYERQLDVEESAESIGSSDSTVPKNIARDACCGAGWGFIIGSLLLIAIFIVPLVKSWPGGYAITTTAINVEPIVIPAVCAGGYTLIGNTGVTYVVQNRTIVFYDRQFCGGQNGQTVQDFITQLRAQYPVGSQVTVWYYPATLPVTYTSNPYEPIQQNIFFWTIIFALVCNVVGIIFVVFARLKMKKR